MPRSWTILLVAGLLAMPLTGWSATQSFSGFDLVYQDRDSGQVSVVAQSLADNLSTIQRDIGLTLRNRITVYLYTTEEYAQLVGDNSHLKNSVAYYSGADRSIRMIYGWTATRSTAATLNDTVLRHELTHAVVHSYSPYRRPTWFEEGLARYCEYGQGLVKAQRLRVQQDARRNILAGTTTHEMAPYDIGVVMIDYLIERSGANILSAIMAQMQRRSFEVAFQSAVGITPAAFETEFRQAMR
jgi:hypothetical protein